MSGFHQRREAWCHRDDCQTPATAQCNRADDRAHEKRRSAEAKHPERNPRRDALFAVLCGCGHNIRMILRHLRAVLHRLIRLIRQICMIIHAEMALCQRDQVDKMAAGQRCSGRTKRGGKASKRGLSSEQVPVLVIVDRSGTTASTVLPAVNAETLRNAIEPIVTSDILLVSDGNKSAQYTTHGIMPLLFGFDSDRFGQVCRQA